MYYTYILYSEKFDRFYIGHSDNLKFRIVRHNEGMVQATKAYIPWEIKYYEEYKTRSQAMKREKFLKKQRNKDFYWRLINSQSAESRVLGINH